MSHDPKRLITPVVNRTLHTYHSVLRILCDAFQIDAGGRVVRCEKRLIEEARRINHAGKMLAPIIDDAHLIDVGDLRRLRLLFEDFPKNHNLVLVAQPGLLSSLELSPNHDIQSRVTYSVLVQRLAADDMERFIYRELDAVALPHATFTRRRSASSSAPPRATCAAPATSARAPCSRRCATASAPSTSAPR